MSSPRAKHGFLRVCVVPSLLFLLCSTFAGAAAQRSTLKRSRRSQNQNQNNSFKHKGAHHQPLTDEQKADQNLQFMLNLYRSAAEPDGRPKQHRKFGSNTVRLLRPTASSMHYLPASGDHHYAFTVKYNIDTLPSEQLVRASFVHLRSSSTPNSTTKVQLPPRCRAQITSMGSEILATLEPHEKWTETDITAHVTGHVQQGRIEHLTLTAQYWCTEPGYSEDTNSLWWWLLWGRYQTGFDEGKERWEGEIHLEVPSLLLYLEEDRGAKDWMGELQGAEGEDASRRQGHKHPPVRRRRSKESADPSLDVLKKIPTSSSSASFSPSASVVSAIPNYKRKTSTPKNRCKLHSFRLSFDELGWGHYIAPPVYYPSFCQGDCPRVLHYGYHSPNHAIIQTLINDLGIGDVPPLSCVPFKYVPLSVLVLHNRKVEYRELEDMVAESCTCR
ncbi:bone morphogenetic protein 15 [Genypterus blacodes]|uniref:bone morphogenetic protein 15 n=1 Tax=Genypterus blacodes TaxID=154954 RepID=UPI003F777EFC